MQLPRKGLVSSSYSSTVERFQQRSYKDFVSNKELFKCCSKFSFQYKNDCCTIELCVCNEAYSTLCEKREVHFSCDTSQAFDTHRVYNQSTVMIVMRSNIQKRYHSPQFRHLPRAAAWQEKNGAMWRATGVLAVKNRLRDYRLFQANYGTVLQYWFLAQLTRENSQVIYGSTTLQFRLGVLKRTSGHKR